MCDQVIESHQAELKAKQEELEQDVAACNRLYQSKMAQLEADYEEQLRQSEAEKNSSIGGGGTNNTSMPEEDNSWNWERATSIDKDAVQDIQRTPTREQRQEQLRQMTLSPPPATLSVVTMVETSQCNHSHSLEDASEFPYLKNVLYQYMLGKESDTLARVLATVVKFTPEELREVLRVEEKKHSLLSSLGILPHH